MINQGFSGNLNIELQVASNLKNASNLWSSQFNPNINSSQGCNIQCMGLKYDKNVLRSGRDGQFVQIIPNFEKNYQPFCVQDIFQDILYPQV